MSERTMRDAQKGYRYYYYQKGIHLDFVISVGL
jgi:hypothetical protein